MKTKIKIKNGFKKEYVQYPDSGQWILLFTLDDGQKITISELAKKINSTIPCARSRLNKSSDPKVIFNPNFRARKKPKNFVAREFLLDSHKWYTDPLVKLMLK